MVKDFYDQKDQRVFYVHESVYGTPFGGTAWTVPPSTFPYWQRLNIIGETIDTPVPIRKKKPLFDIGSGKHPSHIVNEMYEPVDYTFDMELQDPAMFAYAIGDATHVGSIAEISTILCDTKANSVESSYFFFEIIGTSATGNPALHYCWINTGAGSDPVIANATAHECDISGISTAIEVAGIIAGVINGITDVSAANGGTATVTITNDWEGSCIDIRDSGVVATGYTFAITTQGASTITLTENLGHSLQSFTLYVQQKNTGDASEDLCKVYFGCIVDTYVITIDKENSTVKQSITFKSPYADDGNVSTEPPPINKTHPFTWNTLQSDELALAVSSTSYLPKSTTSLTLNIANNTEIKPEISSTYNQHPISAKREVTMTIVGFTDSDDLYDLYEDIWNNTDGYLESIASQLDSDINLERTASTDYMRIYIYNWFVEEHDFKIFSITDAIKGVDLIVRGGTPDSNGELFSNGSSRPTVVSTDNLRKYHNT